MANANTTLIAFTNMWFPTTRDELNEIQYMENPKFRLENSKGAWTLVGENIYKFSFPVKSKNDGIRVLQVLERAAHMHDRDECDADMVVKFGEMAARGIPVYL